MGCVSRILFGRIRFDEQEDYLQFRFKFLCIVLLIGAVATIAFIVGNHSHVNPINDQHVRSMTWFSILSLALWAALRGRKRWFLPIAVLYELICLAEYVSALYYVSEDELRILWVFTNIPGVYILLGQRSGMVVTIFSVLGFVVGNDYLPAPYSPNAVATAIVSMTYLGIFFHFYSDRSISYFLRMRDSNEKLSHMANHDPLTGVYNARAYYAACNNLIELSRRNRTDYAVLFVDLDHFKVINDTHGHATGDTVLKTVANELRKSIRGSDILGRVGGEEFSIFLPDTDEKGACIVAETLRVAIERLEVNSSKAQFTITASIGVATKTGDSATIADIQQRADQAMYLAKKAGRNRVSGC